MQPSLTDLVHEWHDFFLLVGTASATLVGLMFVAASIGAQVFTEKNREGMRAFISPTVVHFGAALFICMAAVVGYLLVMASAVLVLERSPWSLDALAAALITLLFAGIRNAWDMTMWIVIRVPVSGAEKEDQS